MSILTLVHAVVVGALLLGAAGLAEAGLRILGRPSRWIWPLAMLATLAAPLWAPALQRAAWSGPVTLALHVSGDPFAAVTPGDQAAPSPALSTGSVAHSGLPLPPALTRARSWLAAVWGGATALALGLLALGLYRLHRRTRRWPRAEVSGEGVLLSPDFGPAVVGLIRPRTVLPGWALGLDPGDLRLVVRHEAAHRAARDPLLLALGAGLATLAPWNPALWAQARRLREAVEVDCDRRLLARGVDRTRYGQVLIAVRERGANPTLPVPALLDSPHSLERRLIMMFKPRRPGALAIPALLGAAALVVMACETPAPGVVDPDDAAEAPAAAEIGEPGGQVVLRTTPDAPTPLIIVDGEVREGSLSLLTDLDIQSIQVHKGEEAVERFGPEARDGVVEVLTKAHAQATGSVLTPRDPGPPPPPTSGVVSRMDRLQPEDGAGRILATLSAPGEDRPLFIVAGVIVDGPLELDPERVESIEVVKGAAAAQLYGSRARNGVVQIRLKDGGGGDPPAS